MLALGEGQFLYDETGLDAAALQSGLQSAMGGPPPFEPGEGGPPGQGVFPLPDYGCGLWLAIDLTNNAALLTLHHTLPGTNYSIWSKTNLAAAVWTAETNVAGATGTNVTQVLVPTLGPPYLFFVASVARDYINDESFAGLSDEDTGSNPPDTMSAVGPNHFVELLNGRIAVFDKTGQFLTGTNSSIFFAVQVGGTNYPTGLRMVDPRIVFDPQADRWVACALDSASFVPGKSFWPSARAIITSHPWR